MRGKGGQFTVTFSGVRYQVSGSGVSGEGYAGDLLEVVQEGDVVPVGEERSEGFALALTDFEGEQAVGPEGGFGLRDEAAVDVESGGAGIEGGGGFVVADLGMELGLIRGRDVGRVADDGVEGFGVGFVVGGEEVGVLEVDAVGYVVEAGVGFSNFEGFGGDVDGGDFGVGEMGGERDGDGSGAGADVGDAEGLVCVDLGHLGKDGLDEVLGLGAGDEDGWRDVEGEAVELLLAGDVLDGFVVEAAGDGCFVARGLFGGEGAFRVGEERRFCDVEGVEEEELGVAVGVGLEVLAAGERLRGSGEGLAERHGLARCAKCGVFRINKMSGDVGEERAFHTR